MNSVGSAHLEPTEVKVAAVEVDAPAIDSGRPDEYLEDRAVVRSMAGKLSKKTGMEYLRLAKKIKK